VFDRAEQKTSPEESIFKKVKPSKWILPDAELLSEGQIKSVPQETLGKMSRIIEETLADHGVQVSVEDVRVGPRVIRFGIVPGWIRRYIEASSTKLKEHQANDATRVKVQSILSREQDLSLALKTADLRIEAPVPGEGLVGLEVPNPSPYRVYLRSITEHSSFKR
jgi:S-DNA-T family DNA segregation ATPase FtsK/SpoIIIE